MDIYEYLKKDHERVAELFKQFEKATSPVYKTDIVAMIITQLSLHATSEQATFYKALENFKETKEVALHGEKEHKEIEELMNDIVKPQSYDKSWERKVLRLKKIVDHHVKDEEGEMFRKAKKVLTEEDAYILKEKMHYFKEKLLHATI